MTVGMGGIGYLALMWYRLRKDKAAALAEEKPAA
jgi:hypothetical protein